MLIQKDLLNKLIDLAGVSIEYMNDKWITVKPHGEDSKGTHLLVKDGETSKQAVERKFGDAKNKKETESNYTKSDVINKGWQSLKAKIGEKKAKKYFEQADRLINPNEHNIVEYRESGIITKEKNKYTFHALSDTSLKQWRIGFKTDVSDQF